MSESKKNDAAVRIRYEPPVLLDLGSGVAHAQNPHCMTGGSPDGNICDTGVFATEEKCQTGTTAGKKCDVGTTAAGQCLTGDDAGK